MGARTNFELQDSKGSVWLYSHWGGDSKVQDLAEALYHAGPRWGDDSYAMRIVVSRLIGEAWSGETGYGIGSYEFGEESYLPISVHFPSRTVSYDNELYSFVEFVAKYYLKTDEHILAS